MTTNDTLLNEIDANTRLGKLVARTDLPDTIEIAGVDNDKQTMQARLTDLDTQHEVCKSLATQGWDINISWADDADDSLGSTRNRRQNHYGGTITMAPDKTDISGDKPTIISQTDERGAYGDPDPCEEFLVVDGEKVPVTGVRVNCYPATGVSREKIIDFDVVERDGDNLYATAWYGDECVELSRGKFGKGKWRMVYFEHPTSEPFEIVWER